MQTTEEYIRGGTQKANYTLDEVVSWPCPHCGSQAERLIKVERAVLRIVCCTDCQLIRVNPRLDSPHEIYQGDQDIYEEEFKMVRNGRFPHHRDTNYRRILKKLKQVKPTGNFLDIGTNTGSFLRLARGQGWNLTGVEPSPQLARFAREWWDLEVLEGFLEQLNLPKQHFDVITMTDVLEHVVNPAEVLNSVRSLLKPDGVLFIKVPNVLFSLLKYRVRKWTLRPSTDDFDAYEHVCHYTQETLRKLLNANGFDALEIFAEAPVQLPVWQKFIGHYYQHASPFALSWKTNLARSILFRLSQLQQATTGKVGPFAPNLGCLARPSKAL